MGPRNSEGGQSERGPDDHEQPSWGLWQNRILTPQVNAIVKNTFVNVVETDSEANSLRRSVSDGDLSRSSGESQPEQVVGYFLPSLWSSSNSSDKRTAAPRNFENAPWVMHSAVGASSLSPQQSQASASSNWRQPLSAPTAFSNHLQWQSNNPTSQASSSQQQASAAHPAHVGSSPDADRRPLGMLQGGPAAPQRMNEPMAAEYEPNPNLMNQMSQASQSSRAVVKDVACSPQDGEAAEADATSPHIDERLASLDKATLVAEIYSEMKGRIKLEKLEEMAKADVLARIPRNCTDELSSVGSIYHFSGTCTPCAYWFKRICKYSISCHYCHFAHDGQKSKRLRPSKQTRMRIRRWEAQKAVENSSTGEGPPFDPEGDGAEDSDSQDGDVQGSRRIESL